MSKKNYRPENPEYKVAPQYEAYPHELTFNGDTADAVIKTAMEQLIAEASKDNAWRILDDTEIENYRAEYTALMENDKQVAEARIAELAAEDATLKEKMKAAREAHQSIVQHINDNVRIIKDGAVYEPLNPEQSLRIAIDGHYLHYTYTTGGKLVLAKVEEVSSVGQGSIFTRQTRNQEVFIRMFGCKFTPSDTFEEIAVTKETATALEGRKLAAAALREWEESFIDEDTGQVVDIIHTEDIVERDTELTAEDIETLLDEGVESVVVYKVKEAADDAPAA